MKTNEISLSSKSVFTKSKGGSLPSKEAFCNSSPLYLFFLASRISTVTFDAFLVCVMAGTRFRLLDDSIKQLQETTIANNHRLDSLQTMIAEQQQSFLEIFRLLDAMDAKLDRLVPRLTGSSSSLATIQLPVTITNLPPTEFVSAKLPHPLFPPYSPNRKPKP
ncbi:hypothetical protein NE237_024161 [Protea cynaroides]|uniref:Uncharacterized protein n=1 Tax=Protea cynaroides TaxID=273540 RepID=A0A9Q0HD45_9MAGN|nr:hypothetical protein NE237_024161 [Protea cynaroides]